MDYSTKDVGVGWLVGQERWIPVPWNSWLVGLRLRLVKRQQAEANLPRRTGGGGDGSSSSRGGGAKGSTDAPFRESRVIAPLPLETRNVTRVAHRIGSAGAERRLQVVARTVA